MDMLEGQPEPGRSLPRRGQSPRIRGLGQKYQPAVIAKVAVTQLRMRIEP